MPGGIYALLSHQEEVGRNEIKKLYNNPHIAGIVIRTSWKTLEPEEGQYRWDDLDRQIALAAKHGKKVSLHIRTARDGDIQEWLLAKRPPVFKYEDCKGDNPGCGNIGILIVPWDPVLLTHWTRFLKALGERYHDDPTIAYANGLTGSVTNGWGLPEKDAEGRRWDDPLYGYEPGKLLQAIKQVVDTVMQAFPTKKVLVAIGAIRLETPEKKFWHAEQIAHYVATTYPGQYVLFREDLYACTPNPPDGGYWAILYRHRGHTGAQLLQAAVGGRHPPANRDPLHCLPEAHKTPAGILRATTDVSSAYGVPYLEVYKADILASKKDQDLAAAINEMAKTLSAMTSAHQE